MAEIVLKVKSDQAEAIAGMRAIEDANRRVGVSAREASSISQTIYREEIKALDFRARGMHALAADIDAENNLRRTGLKLAKEFQISETAGLNLARERLAVERQIAQATAQTNTAARLAPPPISRPGLSGQRISGSGTSTGSNGIGSKSGDATQAFYIAQDALQGGPAATLNQLPIALDLASRYTQRFTGAISRLGPVMGAVTVAALDAGAYWLGGKAAEMLTGNNGAVEGDAETAKWTNSQSAKLRAAQQEKARDMAREYSASRADLGRREALGGGLAVEDAARTERVIALQEHLKRIQLESLPVIERLRAQAEAESVASEEKNARELLTAQAKVDLQNQRLAESRKRVSDMEAEMEAIRKAPPGTSGPDAPARYTYLKNAIEGERHRAKSLAEDPSNSRALRDAESRRDNELPKERELRKAEAEKAIADFTRATYEQGAAAFQSLGKIFNGFFDSTVKSAKEKTDQTNRARGAADQDMQVLELRARGKNRQADKLEKETSISRSARELEEGPEHRTPEEARKLAEQRYDLTHRTPGRIRGAGYRVGGGGDASGSALDNYLVPGQHMKRPGEDAAGWSGLDGLGELQKKNQRVRGAGFKGTQNVVEAGAAAIAGAALGPGGAAALPAILNAISGVRKDLAALTAASRTIRR